MPRPIALASLLVTAALAAACDSSGLAIEVTASTPAGVTLGPSARATISVYGYDPLLADAPASLIARQILPATSAPLVLDVVLPADAVARIDQGAGPVSAERARFYLAEVYVDVDSDLAICDGDLEQDFTGFEFTSFDADGPAERITFSLRVRDSGRCDVFPTTPSP